MKKLMLALSVALAVGLVGADAAEAGGRDRHGGRGHYRARRRTGMPLAFRHQPYHPFSRHYAYHPHRYRPYRGYYYWPFGYWYRGYPDCRVQRGPCPEEAREQPAQDVEETDFDHGEGWDRLGEGNPYDAMHIFAEEADANPNDGVAKIGLGLAAAETGDLARGVWAMRRALRVDAESIRYVPVDRRIAGRIRALMSAYRADAQAPDKRADYSFMLAALHYLVDERAAARDEVRLALEYGDRSNSANNLDKMLRGEEVVTR